jgi:hypothetical protein
MQVPSPSLDDEESLSARSHNMCGTNALKYNMM